MSVEQDDTWWAEAECKRCGKTGLFWQETVAGYRLFEHRPHGSIAEHRCNYKNHFEDLA